MNEEPKKTIIDGIDHQHGQTIAGIDHIAKKRQHLIRWGIGIAVALVVILLSIQSHKKTTEDEIGRSGQRHFDTQNTAISLATDLDKIKRQLRESGRTHHSITQEELEDLPPRQKARHLR